MTKPISTRAHGIIDLAYAAALIALPFAFRWSSRATQLSVGTGLATLGVSLLTKYEFGMVPVIPMKGHLAMDAAESSLLMAAPRVLGSRDGDAAKVLATFGAVGVIIGSLTQMRSPLELQRRQHELGFA
jgi:hypothetical protein